MGADYLAEKRLTKIPSMNAIWRGFLTPVLTTSYDGKRVKIANLGIAKTMCDNSRLSNYKAYASAE